MDTLQLVNKYEDAIYRSGQTDRFFITYESVGTGVTETEARNLARSALWFVAKENPKTPTSTLLRKAKQLYSRWLREDHFPACAQYAFAKRHGAESNANFFIRNWFAIDDCVSPPDWVELESEVYNCLDFIIRNCGVHLGLWAILSFALQDPQVKSQTIYKYMGLNCSNEQRKAANLIVKKLQKLIGDF